jgi:predicted glycosyltransferase
VARRKSKERAVVDRAGQRVLIYSHDTYGLGHLRRSLLIAEGLASSPDFGSTLIATGSPRTQAFSLPPGTDTVKLPAAVKTPLGGYQSRTLQLSIDDMVQLRAEILRTVARSYLPDLILVDHAPAGMMGELHPLFDEFHLWRPRPHLVLGLRDVIDEANRVRAEWDRLGAWPLLEEAYDRVLVYGDPAVPSTAEELGLPNRLPGRVIPVGYLGRSIERSADSSDPYFLVTAGGGGDGHAVLRAYVSYLEGLPGPAPFRSVLVTGPLLSPGRQREVATRARHSGQAVDVIPFTESFEDLLGGAAGVVSMAGYNTVMEILSAGVPALLVPRETPRLEQRIRAERLARVTDIEVCGAGRLDARRIGRFVDRVLADGQVEAPPIDLGGVERTVRVLGNLLQWAAPPAVKRGRHATAIA